MVTPVPESPSLGGLALRGWFKVATIQCNFYASMQTDGHSSIRYNTTDLLLYITGLKSNKDTFEVLKKSLTPSQVTMKNLNLTNSFFKRTKDKKKKL